MWHEARANEKRIKELMVDHKKRAERRRAYYESRRGDPRQLLRVVGSAILLHPDAEQYYHHENLNTLMPWQGDPDIKIDRFDGRSLLDFVPSTGGGYHMLSKEDKEMSDDLNFERYHDLVETERLKVSEQERLSEVEEEWNQLLDRHKALLAMIHNDKKSDRSHGFGYDYGTHTIQEDVGVDHEPQLLKEADILQYVDELNDKDRQTLNDMAKKYGIRSYARLLRVAKKDRDDELRELKNKDPGSKDSGYGRRSKEDRKHRKRSRTSPGHHSRRERENPSYEPYIRHGSDSESSIDEETATSSGVVIEFGSDGGTDTLETESSQKLSIEKHSENTSKHIPPAKSKISTKLSAPTKVSTKPPTPTPTQAPIEEKKLTPMEKLKLKMRAGLEKQIQLDERDKRRKRLEKDMEEFQSFMPYTGPVGMALSSSQSLNSAQTSAAVASSTLVIPSSTLVIPSSTERYRSPSSSRSPSPVNLPHRQKYDKSSSISSSPAKSSKEHGRRRYSPSRPRSPAKSSKEHGRRRYSPSRSRSPTKSSKEHGRRRYSPSRSRSPAKSSREHGRRRYSPSRSCSPNYSSYRQRHRSRSVSGSRSYTSQSKYSFQPSKDRSSSPRYPKRRHDHSSRREKALMPK